MPWVPQQPHQYRGCQHCLQAWCGTGAAMTRLRAPAGPFFPCHELFLVPSACVGLCAHPPWVARAIHCPSTIAVGPAPVKKADRKPHLGQPSSTHASCQAPVLGGATFVSLSGWLETASHGTPGLAAAPSRKLSPVPLPSVDFGVSAVDQTLLLATRDQ